MIKSNRCNKSLNFFFSLSYLEMCSKTNFPTSLKKFYMYRYMLASLSKMTYVEVYIHFSQIRCCFIQSFDYVTHYMIFKKYLTSQRWIWIGIDHTWWLTALLYQAMVYWSELIPGWSVIICTNYKVHVSKYEGENTKRTMGSWWAMIVVGFLIDVFQRMLRTGFCGHDL